MTEQDVVGQMLAGAESGDCTHPRVELRARRVRNGAVQYRRQCLDCGESASDAVARAAVQLPVPEWDDNLLVLWRERMRDEYERRREAERAKWAEEHDAYLGSAKWRALRARVLERDKYLCQGCHVSPATEVHHLTYTHWGNELLFQLVSLCASFHDLVHGRVDGK